MKNLYLLLLFFTFIQCAFAQSGWQEHFSHDRTAYNHIGHFVVDGEIVLLMGNWESPMNTLETIKGNIKKDVSIISPYNVYWDIKTTTTGIDEKEILLLDPFDYDITGIGLHSIRSKNNSLFTRSINFINDEYPYISDAFMPLDSSRNRECVTISNEWLTLDNNDNVIDTVLLQNTFRFYEAPGAIFQINESVLNPLYLPADHPGGLQLGQYDKLENDPYRNQIVVIKDCEMIRHTIEDCEYVRTDQLEGEPLDIIFIEEGFYYLVETELNLKVYRYLDDEGQSELWYELLKEDEILDFRISNFEVIGEDIYFLGLLKRSNPPGRFSYVQKRNKNIPFEPIRKDVSLDSISVSGSPTGPNQWDLWKYEYWFKVTNNSEDTIRHFSVLSNSMTDIFSFPMRLVALNVEVDIAPGASYEGTGEYNFYEQFQLTLHLAGADFGLDDDVSNNSFTADIKTVSSKDVLQNIYKIAPNPTSDYISLLGEMNDIIHVAIMDNFGNTIRKEYDNLRDIEVSNLAKGQYWIHIITKSGIEIHPFIKT